jgi:hypothetical protein
MLAASSLPPLTADANRHRPRPAQPGNPHAAANVHRIAVTAPAAASTTGRNTAPPSSAHSAANATPSSPARAAKRRRHSRAVVCGTPTRAAAGRTPATRAVTASITCPTLPATSNRPAAGTPATARATPGSAHTGPGNEDPPTPARFPHPTPITRPETHRHPAQRALRAWRIHPTTRRRIRIDRQRTQPYDGHGHTPASDPFPRTATNSREKGSLAFHRQPILPPGRVTKQRGRTPPPDARAIRPSTGGMHRGRRLAGGQEPR